MAVAAPVGATGVAHGAVVDDTPRGRTPAFLDNEVRAGLQVGNRIIVGGDFTQVEDDTFGLVDQPYLAAYDLVTGRLDLNFLPDLDGGVNSIADAGGGTIIVVGVFNTVNGATRRSVAKLNVVDGSLVTAFRANAGAEVQDVAVGGNRVYIGGSFTTVNGVSRSRLAAVDLTTGAVAGDFDFPLTEPTGLNGAGGVRALDVTPDGTTLLVGHNSHRVAGEVRQSVALIDIEGTPALLDWQTDNYDYDCQPWFPQFERPLMRDLQVSPDGSFFVVATSIGNYAPGCDVAVRFPVAGGEDTDPDWVSRLFDTPEAVAVSDEAVYVGGHFRWLMDAGAVWTDYPDGNTDEQPPNTVVRDQIGALDPDTGTALDWNPGATGFRGVLALRVTDAGLLVGSDGEWMGGRRVYRHGMFELPAAPSSDVVAPTTTITTPVAGASVDAPVAFAGTATDDEAVEEVLVSIQNRDTQRYLQLDGTFTDDGWQLHRAFVPDAFSPSSTWLWTADLPDGSYHMTARADDLAGNRGPSVEIDFVVGEMTDVEPPDGSIAVPITGQQFEQAAVTFTGSAADDFGVDKVRVIIRDRTTGEYLQRDGTMAPSFAKLAATLPDRGASTTDWEWSGSLPDGRYRLRVHVVDTSGLTDPTKASRNFLVDTKAPNGKIVVPERNETLTGGAVNFNGTATDLVGVRRALIVIKDRDTGEYLQKDGSMAPAVAKLATSLSDKGAPATDWTWTGTIPDGRYRLILHVVDVVGHRDPTKAGARFVIE